VLCCVLDLAVPVAPTATGIEWEDDEEVAYFTGWRLPRPVAARPGPRDEARRRQAARPAPARTAPVRTRAIVHIAPRPHLTAADPSPTPPPGEDH